MALITTNSRAPENAETMSTAFLRWRWSASARGLAVLRIVVGVVALGSADVRHAADVVPAIDQAIRAPALAGPLLALLPRGEGFVDVAVVVTLIAAAATALGLFTRVATTTLTAGLFVVLGLVQLGGTPVHIHHLLWLSLLLALSPCGAAWSIDRWRRRAGHDEREKREDHDDDPDDADDVERAAGRTLLLASLVLGAVYLFPGLHKLVDTGSPFFDADALARLVRLKAFEAGADVPFGLDAHPALLVAGAVLVVVVELAVPVFAIVPRLRPLAGAAMLGLHAALGVVLFIPYTALAVFAVVFFVPLRGQRVRDEDRRRPRRREQAAWVAGGALVVGVVVAGAVGAMHAFPVACYPTFARAVPRTLDDVLIEVDDGAGFVVVPRDVWAPLPVRTAVLGAARRVRTEAQARRWLRQRCRDDAFRALVARADAVAVVRARLDLGVAGLPVVNRHPLATLRGAAVCAR